MYAQGLASIALCEACAMTDDSALRLDAQAAVDFICYAQNAGGGWRYQPKQPGDVTVTGWQMMALKSGQMGGLVVPSPTLMDAAAFLDGVQQDDGAFYGYLKPGKEPTPTAVGLLVRMYSGWSHDDARLRRGVEYLSRLGPSDDDVYFNYYATQVMHHYGGPHWERWNRQMREAVIAGQAQQGHERGSWYVDHEYGLAGGRLYTTAMCVMILEVYYRHMPLYRQQAIDTPF